MWVALVEFCDSDYPWSVDTGMSQLGYIFTLFGASVRWKSSFQNVVALSTTEAKYFALTSAVKESFWLKGIAADFAVEHGAIAISCDNDNGISLVKQKVSTLNEVCTRLVKYGAYNTIQGAFGTRNWNWNWN